MPDEYATAQADTLAATIEGARRRSPDVPPNQDTTDKFPTNFEIQVFPVLAGPTWTECTGMSAPFKIRSVRIDNGTNQWLQLGPRGDFIRPFTYGIIYNVRGMGSVSVFRNTPPGTSLVNPTPSVGQSFTVTVYDKPQAPNSNIFTTDQARQIAQPITSIMAAGNIGAIGRTIAGLGGAQFGTLRAVMVASATVGNRNVAIDVVDGALNIVLSLVDSVVITAGQTRIMNFSGGGNPGTAQAIGGVDWIDAPNPLYIPSGGGIHIYETAVVDATDQISFELVSLPIV